MSPIRIVGRQSRVDEIARQTSPAGACRNPNVHRSASDIDAGIKSALSFRGLRSSRHGRAARSRHLLSAPIDSFGPVTSPFAELGSTGAVSISLLGYFNPLILQPNWLLANELIDEDDFQHLTDDENGRFVVSAEFTGLRLAWAKLETTRDACTLTSDFGTDTPDRIRELAVGIFQLLPHTPIEQVTLIYFRHFALPDDNWAALARRLAPPAPFESAAPGASLQSLQYVVEREGGHLSIVVEPSVREDFSVFIGVEDALEFEAVGDKTAQRALRALDERWDATRGNAEAIMRSLVLA